MRTTADSRRIDYFEAAAQLCSALLSLYFNFTLFPVSSTYLPTKPSGIIGALESIFSHREKLNNRIFVFVFFHRINRNSFFVFFFSFLRRENSRAKSINNKERGGHQFSPSSLYRITPNDFFFLSSRTVANLPERQQEKRRWKI